MIRNRNEANLSQLDKEILLMVPHHSLPISLSSITCMLRLRYVYRGGLPISYHLRHFRLDFIFGTNLKRK